MSNLTANEVKGLMEAYQAVHNPELRQELEEEQQEIQELALDIIENAAYVLFSQGYNVDDLITYFTEAKTDVIVEDFVNFAKGSLLIESVAVSDEYIEEQFEQLNERLGGLLRGAANLVGRAWNAGKGLVGAGRGGGPIVPAVVRDITPKGGAIVRAGSSAITPTSRLSRAANSARGLMSRIPGSALAGRVAQSGVGKALGRAMPGIGAALYGVDAVDRAKKGDWGGAALSGIGAGLSLVPGVGTLGSLAPAAIQMGTDALGWTGDKSLKKNVKAAPDNKAKYNASAALGGQTAFKAGGGSAAMRNDPNLSAADIQRRGNASLRASAGGDLKKGAQIFKAKQEIMSGKPSGSAPAAPAAAAPAAPAAAAPSRPATSPGKPPAGTPPTGKPSGQPNARVAEVERLRQDARNKGLDPTSKEFRDQVINPVMYDNGGRTPEQSQEKWKDTPYPGEKQDQTPTTGPELTKDQQRQAQQSVDDLMKAPEDNKPAPAGTALAAEQERRRRQQQNSQTSSSQQAVGAGTLNNGMEYDPFDMVLEYLTSEGHVETLDEALYVMMEMDSETIQDICEAHYGTKAGRHKLAMKIKKGKPVGKSGPGTGFKAVESAAKKGGARDPEAVAAAAMWKTYGGKKGKKKSKTQKEY